MRMSVCVPTYRGTEYIGPMLESVLSQSFEDFEVIISNDSPEDDHEMKSLLADIGDARIHFHANEKNLGYPGNLKRCLEEAAADVVFLMAQDDIVLDRELFLRQETIVGISIDAIGWWYILCARRMERSLSKGISSGRV